MVWWTIPAIIASGLFGLKILEVNAPFWTSAAKSVQSIVTPDVVESAEAQAGLVQAQTAQGAVNDFFSGTSGLLSQVLPMGLIYLGATAKNKDVQLPLLIGGAYLLLSGKGADSGAVEGFSGGYFGAGDYLDAPRITIPPVLNPAALTTPDVYLNPFVYAEPQSIAPKRLSVNSTPAELQKYKAVLANATPSAATPAGKMIYEAELKRLNVALPKILPIEFKKNQRVINDSFRQYAMNTGVLK
jgi:hypothetical protein